MFTLASPIAIATIDLKHVFLFVFLLRSIGILQYYVDPPVQVTAQNKCLMIIKMFLLYPRIFLNIQGGCQNDDQADFKNGRQDV